MVLVNETKLAACPL